MLACLPVEPPGGAAPRGSAPSSTAAWSSRSGGCLRPRSDAPAPTQHHIFRLQAQTLTSRLRQGSDSNLQAQTPTSRLSHWWRSVERMGRSFRWRLLSSKCSSPSCCCFYKNNNNNNNNVNNKKYPSDGMYRMPFNVIIM